MHVHPFHIDAHTNNLSRRLVRAFLTQFRDKISLYVTYDLSTLNAGFLKMNLGSAVNTFSND